MNAPAPSGEPPKKPVIELLQDIHGHAKSPPRPEPLLPPGPVVVFVYVASLVALALSVIVLLSAIWGGVTAELALKCLATIGVIVTALHIFRAMNNQE